MSNTTDKVAFAAAELLAASDALASAAAEVDALRAEVTRQTRIAVDHCARADAAERMVAELREKADSLRHEVDILTDGEDNPRRHVTYADGRPVVECEWKKPLRAAADTMRAALASTAEVAGRWVSVEVFKRHREALLRDMDRVGADVVKARAERDAAIAARDEAVANLETVARVRDAWIAGARRMAAHRAAAERARDEVVAILDAERKHSAEELDEVRAERDAAIVEKNDAIRARDEVGIQLAAAQAEIARMRPVVEAASVVVVHYDDSEQPAWLTKHVEALREAIRVFRAVPGDALAPVVPPSPAGASAPASGSTPAASSATSSSSEAVGNPSVPRGTCDASVRALIDAARAVDRCYDTGSSIRRSMYRLREVLDGLRITAALEASGIDADNVKGVE